MIDQWEFRIFVTDSKIRPMHQYRRLRSTTRVVEWSGMTNRSQRRCQLANVNAWSWHTWAKSNRTHEWCAMWVCMHTCRLKGKRGGENREALGAFADVPGAAQSSEQKVPVLQ